MLLWIFLVGLDFLEHTCDLYFSLFLKLLLEVVFVGAFGHLLDLARD